MFNKELPALSFPPPVPPPNLYPPMDFDDAVEQNQANWEGLYKTMKAYEQWLYALASNVYRYAEATNHTINGQIEFPTPDATDHTGNMKVSYVQIFLSNSGGASISQAVPHGYGDGQKGQAPRGWFLMRNSSNKPGAATGQVLDQIISSQAYQTYSGANAPQDVTITSATTITAGTGTFAGIWAQNDVRVGDMFKAYSTGVIVPTGSSAAGSGVVTLSAAPATWPLVGWPQRYSSALGAGETDNENHRVIAVDRTNLKVTVYPPYVNARAAANITATWFDRTWVPITAVSAAGNTLTLGGVGTEVPVGTTGCDYVIRRPADDTYLWLRYVGGSYMETTLAVY